MLPWTCANHENLKAYPRFISFFLEQKYETSITHTSLVVPKSSGGDTLFSYRRLEEIFFIEVIEKMKLYLSSLSHPF